MPIRAESTVNCATIVIEFNSFRRIVQIVKGSVILILRTRIQADTPNSQPLPIDVARQTFQGATRLDSDSPLRGLD